VTAPPSRQRQLHDPTLERDACGIGFVADAAGRPSREILEATLEALRRVRHRGAFSADRRTGDGAGVILPLSRFLVPQGLGLAMVFARDTGAHEVLEATCRKEGIEVLEWRQVPVDTGALGPYAQSTIPVIEQAVLERPEGDEDRVEWLAYRARRRAERAAPDALYVASLSYRTVTYKALCAADELAHFYPELADPAHAVPFGVFHQRFSTNTLPSWERAQPFRLLCHNGEINALQGNVNWMRAREGRFGSTDDDLLHPVLDERGSDSAMLDNALELLVRGGRDVCHALTMLVPPAWDGDEELEPEIRDFYRYHAGLVEPWDGPAGLVFTDGHLVGAALDRNGLRPLRVASCEDGLVVVCSEAGCADLDGHGKVARGRIGPGQLLAVDTRAGAGGGLSADLEIKRRLAARRPYGTWLADGLVVGTTGEPVDAVEGDLTARQVLFGYTREELMQVFRPIASHGHEPTYSMGDDAAVAPLANRARPLFSYFKQRFAQVTNPPIDHLRERFVFSLRTLLGDRSPILVEGPEAAHGIELESFFLFPDAIGRLGFTRLDATFTAGEGLAAACGRLADEAEQAIRGGGGLLLVSDTGAGEGRPPIPVLLAVGTVHHRLVATGLRTYATIVVESDEPREVHHFACLLGYGAEAIAPRLALLTLADMAARDKIGGDHPSAREAQLRFKSAIEDGVLKVMSKMGISDVASYCGAQLFEAVGLAHEVVDVAFRDTPCPVGGVGFAELEADALARHAAAFGEKPELPNPGYFKYRKGGELHETSTEVVDALHEAVAGNLLRDALNGGGRELYERFAALVNDRPAMELRDLLEVVPAGQPVPLDEVEPVESIVRRFSSGAMSHGALSAEAHELIAIALNRLGGKANSGEGGEDPVRYRSERNCKIKQVASGRFGVTPEYAAYAEELQIKISQGSKPGEGGQLPAHKVSEEIARLRHTQPGVALISPPPHHDIYSIEDLAQLIFDLKQVSPHADVSVKLVAEAGVGLVAAGCVKALADVVHIAGADGGTGASPLSSIKNAGSPWELGLAETQQALVASGLRGRVRVRVDGGLKTGRDVVVAALLGADEYAFGTSLLLAEGCLMVRSCHLDTCPVGIATQKPDLRAKFAATPEQVMSYLTFVAQEIREHLAGLGLRSLDEAVGRVDLLRQRSAGDPRADSLDLAPLLADVRARPESPVRYAGRRPLDPTGHELGDRLAQDAAAILDVDGAFELSYPITNRDRTVGARLGGLVGRIHGSEPPPGRVRAEFEGAAGQSFGAFLSAGIELVLRGEANDYVGKGMGGGRIVVVPPANDAGDPVLMGNTVLYGATGGELFCAGRAGERFAVRMSGATAVVEGTGGHPCEYMTAGTVVILGDTGPNLGAGMSGGEAFVYDPHGVLPLRLNDQLVVAGRLEQEGAKRVHALIARHAELTGSARAADLLTRWDDVARHFWHIVPKTEVARISSTEEGTVSGKLG
jgi:glutamate synthase (ferredoxin)